MFSDLKKYSVTTRALVELLPERLHGIHHRGPKQILEGAAPTTSDNPISHAGNAVANPLLKLEPIPVFYPLNPRTSVLLKRRQELGGWQTLAPPRWWGALLHEYPVGVGSRVVGRLWP